MYTTIVSPGRCEDFRGFTGTRAEPINVYGFHSPSVFWIISGKFRASLGGNVYTYGSSAHAWALTPQF